MSRLTFKYRLYPNRKQAARMEWTLGCCRELYNAALQERRDAWKQCRKSVGFPAQSDQLPAIKEDRPEFTGIYSQVLQDVLHRVDKTFQAFFSRVKRGATAGFPRFKGRHYYDSFTDPQLGFAVAGSVLELSKIGNVKIRFDRPIRGQVKTLTLKRECGSWYACFSVEIAPEPLPFHGRRIGIDVGLEFFAVFSNGQHLENPRYYAEAEPALRIAQRRVARRKKGSNRRGKAVGILQKIHRHIFNQRNDFQHKLSR
jgi:putative transposase